MPCPTQHAPRQPASSRRCLRPCRMQTSSRGLRASAQSWAAPAATSSPVLRGSGGAGKPGAGESGRKTPLGRADRTCKAGICLPETSPNAQSWQRVETAAQRGSSSTATENRPPNYLHSVQAPSPTAPMQRQAEHPATSSRQRRCHAPAATGKTRTITLWKEQESSSHESPRPTRVRWTDRISPHRPSGGEDRWRRALAGIDVFYK